MDYENKTSGDSIWDSLRTNYETDVGKNNQSRESREIEVIDMGRLVVTPELLENGFDNEQIVKELLDSKIVRVL